MFTVIALLGHRIFVIKVSNVYLTLKNISINSQTYKNLQQASYKIIQNLQQATSERERGIQIVMVHGSGREVQPGYSESQIAIWSMLFLL